MQTLTNNETIILNDLKEALKNKDLRAAILVSNYLMSEIEFQFGSDVAEFVIGYRAGLFQNGRAFTIGDVPLLSKAGSIVADGFNGLFDCVVNLIGDAQEAEHIKHDSQEAMALRDSISSIVNMNKSTWIGAYNELQAKLNK